MTRRALRLIVPGLLLAVLWHVADGPGAMARLRGADPLWLILSLAAVLAQTALSALRWQRVARAMGLDLPLRQAVTGYFMAQVVNQTLPGGIPGDAARALRSRGAGGLRRAAEAVAVERIAGQMALFAVLVPALALSLALGRIDWPGWSAWLLAAVPAAAILALTLRLPGWAAPLRVLWQPQVWPAQALLGAAIVALNLAAFACAARATGTTLSPEAVATLVPLILTAMLVPLSVGGWGWREGAAAVLFPLAGATAGAGLAASAAFGAVLLLAAMPGVFWLNRAPTA
ncbi:MAG: lysylphosphatidylglycerol synthase transmembrane domain-containing protein [Gemmobacter sp.]